MAPVFHDLNKSGGAMIVAYGSYKPWTWHKMEGGDGSNYPEFSGRILDLKEGKAHAVEYFRERVEPDLGNGFAVAVVPSHDPESPGLGLRALAAALAQNGGRIDASGCLVRTVKIDKLAHGGDRSINVHLGSIAVTNAALIKGRDVMLLDDVTRTGNSLFACRRLLLDAGARSVQCVALGRTG